MSINNLNTYLNVRDAHLRVVSGNVYAQAMNIGGINVETAHGLQSVSDTGNVTSNTLQFSNATTGFVTTANAQIGRDLVVTGNATVSTDLTVSANATVTDTLTISEHLIASKEATITGNLHVTTIRSDSNVVAEYTGPHDRPLRKYPEVVLTADDNLSTSGYKASVSSLLTGNDAFKAFDVTGATTYWHSQWPYYTHVTGTYNPGQSSGGTGTPSGTLPTTELISGHQGEWIKLQMPKKIKLEEVRVYASNRAAAGVNVYQMPKDIAIAGSNDGTNWYLVDSGTLRTGIRESYGMASLPVTTSSYYSYLALIVKTIDNQGANYSGIEIANIEYYGREEGSGSLDTTLKTVYNVPATTGTQLEVYYDAKGESTVQSPIPDLSPNTNTGAVSGHSPTLDSTDGIDSFKFNGSSQYVTGTHGLTTGSDPVHTISLWLNATEMTNYSYAVQLGQGGTSHQQSAIMFYENRISHAHWISGVLSNVTLAKNVWYHVVAVFTGGNGSDLTKHKIFINGEDGGVGLFPGSTSDGPVVLTGTQLTLGRKENAGGTPGDYFNGSIANFRLYSKALNADQIKELYEYQKDYFFGSKSQVTLYKGHLGVGVTEPSGQLELAGDERLQEYPPRDLYQYDTNIEGHGVFCVSASNEYLDGNHPAWEAFGDNATSASSESVWTTNALYSASTGLHTGSATTAGIKGEWIQLKTPYKIKISSFNLNSYIDSASNRQPRDFILLGSNDGNVWEQMKSVTGQTSGYTTVAPVYSGPLGPHHTVNSTKYYSYFRIVVTANQGEALVGISRIRFYGTPGPTTLDKGSLTLGRSLDVPRVSRYDVDTETPRPEKLVVDFDTTVNSSPTDISGKGNHGTFSNASGVPTYSVADKAFDFDGVNGAIWSGPLSPSMTGDKICSMSAWFKTTNASTVNQQIVWLGAYSIAGLLAVAVSNGTLRISIGSGCSLDVAGVIESNTWYHVVGIKQGTGSITSSNFSSTFKLYLNGEPMTGTFGGTARTLSINTNYWYVGAGTASGNEPFPGYISNPKLYDTILEPSEVRKLYRLGRTGRSMVITDTAVGIGKAPEAQLDVRGVIRGPGLTIQTVSSYKSDTTTFAGTSVTDITGLSVTIHPKFANSQILVSYDVNMGGKGRVFLRVKRVQGSSTTYFWSDQGSGGWTQSPGGGAATSTYAGTNTDAEVNGYPFKRLDNAGGLNPITYTVQGWSNHSVYNVCINRAFVDTSAAGHGGASYWGRCVSSITAQEVCQ